MSPGADTVNMAAEIARLRAVIEDCGCPCHDEGQHRQYVTAKQEITRLSVRLAEQEDTNARLNRRCQTAEGNDRYMAAFSAGARSDSEHRDSLECRELRAAMQKQGAKNAKLSARLAEVEAENAGQLLHIADLEHDNAHLVKQAADNMVPRDASYDASGGTEATKNE